MPRARRHIPSKAGRPTPKPPKPRNPEMHPSQPLLLAGSCSLQGSFASQVHGSCAGALTLAQVSPTLVAECVACIRGKAAKVTAGQSQLTFVFDCWYLPITTGSKTTWWATKRHACHYVLPLPHGAKQGYPWPLTITQAVRESQHPSNGSSASHTGTKEEPEAPSGAAMVPSRGTRSLPCPRASLAHRSGSAWRCSR
jgi:hypothetical protein